MAEVEMDSIMAAAATAAQIGTIFFICFSLIDPITLPETMFRNESKFRKPNKV